MSENGNFERGVQLYDMGRYKDAIPYLKKSLSHDIHNYINKLLLAYSYFHIDDIQRAKVLSKELLSSEPNLSDVHHLAAQISLHENEYSKSIESIDIAIKLNPYDEDNYGTKAYILLALKKYEDALHFANEGLKINAKSRICLNARATCLTKLNRKNEANETIDNLLNEDPENSFSHANVAWSYLENNKVDKALEHFRESLKIDPNDDYARDGMLTAVKAKNRIYNLYLRYAFWISNKSQKNQYLFLIGIYLVYRFSIKILAASGLTIIATPLIILYLIFALGSWIMEPLSNMILLFDRFGKYLLDKDSKLSGQIMFTLLSITLISYSLSFLMSNNISILVSLSCIAAILPLSRAPLSETRNSSFFNYIFGSFIIAVPLIGYILNYDYASLLIAIGIMFIAYTWLGSLIFNK